MQALRYQVNPHFLFNTLNSIAGLIEEGEVLRAERMTLSLSTFLRATLELDPLRDVPLEVELGLQQEYLGIEQERFSDRMCFSINVPAEVRQALVPNLILQPLIENALKHGVGRSSELTEIRIKAWRDDETLWITIENEIGSSSGEPMPTSLGIGLKNVADRIQARFGYSGYFNARVAEGNLFRVKIGLPLMFGDIGDHVV
nr:histidine kinase [Hyphomonas sediminis]